MFFLLPFCYVEKKKIEKKATKEKERQESLIPVGDGPRISQAVSLSLSLSIDPSFFCNFPGTFSFPLFFCKFYSGKKQKDSSFLGFFVVFLLSFVIGLSQYKSGNVSFLRFLVVLQMFSIQKESAWCFFRKKLYCKGLSFVFYYMRNVCLIDVQVSWRQGRYYFAMNESK